MELILYAILVFFIFNRLYASFGRISVERELGFRAAEVKEILEKKVKTVDQFTYVAPSDLQDIVSAKKEIESLWKQDFSTDRFMEGAERAFEMFTKAFADCDLKVLSKLLSKKAFSVVSEKVAQRKIRGNTLERTLVALRSKNLIKLNVIKGVLYATVRFVSEQINVVRDDTGHILSGDRDTIEVIEDKWVFERSLKSPHNSWVVCEFS
ncbi:Tim44/TimA family putative adaptor protein [Neorickettsia findlayensis]|uniref:Large ribosomal subunit protein mL45 n=1 Tax=Neorickettsia findlayensis TaxID=2686014 RepID=A0A6P1G9W9_9RICK|nr:Tim44/TimA family putative adaptor protein [Neorickettsia findlayensis]QHD65122.1 Tim44/TimA family putative adaptor protein [Neorickettsia findlayensis]